MGAMGSKRQPECHRGHALTGENTMEASNGGRRCVACNRALAQAYNWAQRKGLFLSAAQIDALSDEKYLALSRQG